MQPSSPASLTLRPAVATDDLDELNVGAADWMGEHALRSVVAVSDVPVELLVGLVDGVPAGFASAVGAPRADGHRGHAYIYVRSSFRRRGLGTLLWQGVMEVCTPGRVAGVAFATDADDETSQQVATAHGMRLVGLHLESRLDLADVSSHRARLAGTSLEGVEIRPLPEDATAEQWAVFAQLYRQLAQDTPDMAGGAEPVPDVILRSFVAEPWQVMGAWEQGQLIGFTSVYVVNRVQGTLNTYLTAVVRRHRGRGLSTALKAAHAIALSEAGWASITTQNMEGNEPILASNRTLGFVPTGGLRDLVYDFPTNL